MAAAAALLLSGASNGWAVPGNEADPPLPPSTFGNLFDDGSLSVHSCRIAARTGAQASIAFISNYQRTQVSYWKRTGTWSAWSDVASSPWVCAAPECLWGGAQVRLRGCENGSCDAPGCTIRLGVAPGGPPGVAPVALPVTASTVSGCAQSNHSTIRFEARWVGAPASGYPKVTDENAVAVVHTEISRTSQDGIEIGTYTIPAPASGWIDGAQWSFNFSLSSTRSTTATVQVKDHCLNPPVVQQVGGDGNRLALANGQELQSAQALQLAVVSGNPGLALTNHALTPARAFDTPFAAPAVVNGGEESLAWSEKGNAWDTLLYTSADGAVKITGAPCVSGSAARYRISGSADINLGDDTAWTNGPLVESDACSPVSPGAPTAATDVAVAASWQVVAEGSGWRVQARAAQASGLVSSTATYQGSGWDATQTLNALRPAPANCPDGERVVGGVCRGCPEYSVCEDGALATKKHCDTGNPPANARTVSYQDCVGGTTETVTACVASGDPDPGDDACPVCSDTERLVERNGAWVCEELTCPAGQRASGGVCESCPEYSVCESGALVTKKHCGAGNAPVSATEMSYQVCVNGSNETRTVCVSPGGDAPDDDACPACGENERAVFRNGAWVCEPCPEYIGCNQYSRAEKMHWCEAGNPPDNARDYSEIKCLSPDPETGWSRKSVNRVGWYEYNQCGTSPPQNTDSLVELSECVDGRTVTTEVCVKTGRRPPVSTPCTATDCPDGTRLFNGDCVACADGERLVNGACEACPKYIVCNAGGSGTEERSWCSDGSPPANERFTTYQTCSAGGAMVSNNYCGTGTPPASAREVSYQVCESGVTKTRTKCVPPNGTPPASTPCDTACPTGQRRVSGRCQPCPTYTVCTGSQTAVANGRNSLTSSRTFCEPGNPPRSARTTWNIACVGGNSTGVYHCIGRGGLTRDPGDVPCSRDRCIYYEGCKGESGYTRSQMTQQVYRCARNPSPKPAPKVFSRAYCYQDVEYTRYYCVGALGLDSVSDVPDNDYCNTNNCVDYTACSAATGSASANLLTTAEYCGSGSPPANARQLKREVCNGGNTVTRRVCIGSGGYASDPGDNPCGSSCPSNQRRVGGSCQPCPTYYRCDGNDRVKARWCDPGSPPANAKSASYEACSDGETVTVSTCVPPNGSAPADDPCVQREGAHETYCSGGVKKRRKIDGNEDTDVRPDSCPDGQQMNDQGCCEPCEAKQQWCSGSTEKESPLTGCEDNDLRSAKRYYCDGAAKKSEKITGTCTDNNDDLPASCPSGEEKNAAGCCVTETCTKPARPACPEETRSGQTPKWNQSACRYDWKAAPECPAGEVKDGWNEDACEWRCKKDIDPADLATFSNFRISRACGTDGEGVVACSVTLDPSGGLTFTDTGATSSNEGAWGTPNQGVDFAADVLPNIRFSFSQRSLIRVGGSTTQCVSSGLGVMCSHMGGGWVGNSRSTPGGIFDITISDSAGNTLASGRVSLRGGRAVRETPQ